MKIATGRSFDDGVPKFDADREPGPIALVTPVVPIAPRITATAPGLHESRTYEGYRVPTVPSGRGLLGHTDLRGGLRR